MKDVYLYPTDSYTLDEITKGLMETVINPGLLDFVKPGMKIGIKVNLVSAMSPDKGATTNPLIVKILSKMIKERGGIVTIGDSPGGLFTEGILKTNYKDTKMIDCVEEGINLNYDVSTQIIEYEGKVVKSFDACSWLLKQDALINICKLKSHGMMGLSCAVKNMFGTVPGIIKTEYHYRYPKHEDFADMLIDLNEYYQVKLNLVDAVIGMEGNGPTQGTPRKIGLLLASNKPYNLDLICAHIIGLEAKDIPTLSQSVKRGLAKEKLEDITTNIDYSEYLIKDYKNIKVGTNMEFKVGKGPFKFINPIIRKILQVKPKVKKKECIGCQKCFNICPAKAITMKNKIPHIDRNMCIRCFCCQEFCPVGAMKAHKNPIVKLLSKN